MEGDDGESAGLLGGAGQPQPARAASKLGAGFAQSPRRKKRGGLGGGGGALTVDDREKHDYMFKLLMIGDSGVGKSSLLLRFASDEFQETYMSTVGLDFKIRTVEVGDKLVKLQMWDTAGQERFRTITSSCYRGAHGIMLVYSVTDKTSFENVGDWLSQMEKFTDNDDAVKILIANKTDLLRLVTAEEGQQLAEHLGLEYMETSAKTRDHVENAFMLVARRVLDRHAGTANQPPGGMHAAGQGANVNLRCHTEASVHRGRDGRAEGRPCCKA